jgi:hypothetical protein
MNSHVIAFWRQSSIWARISLLLFVVFILLGIENYAMSPRAWVYTTGDGFNTFLSSQGDIIWKHRPHPQDDYVNAVGRGSYFFILHTGFSKTPVHHGTLWTISVLMDCFGLSRQLHRLLHCEDIFVSATEN